MIETGISFRDYVAMDGLNASLAVHGIESAARMRWAMDHDVEETDEMRLGSAAHSLLELTLEQFLDQYAIMPDFANHPDNHTIKNGERVRSTSKATSWYKNAKLKFELDNPDMEYLDEVLFHRAKRMIASLRKNRLVQELLMWEEYGNEVVLTGELLGVPCKARLDLFAPDTGLVIPDLKTTGDIDMQAFGRVFAQKQIAFRLRFYQRLARANGKSAQKVYVLLAENQKGFETARVPVRDTVLEEADHKIDRVLGMYQHGKLHDEWPGRFDTKEPELYVPNWSMPDDDEETTWEG